MGLEDLKRKLVKEDIATMSLAQLRQKYGRDHLKTLKQAGTFNSQEGRSPQTQRPQRPGS